MAEPRTTAIVGLPEPTLKWHTLGVEQTIQKLNAHPGDGLTTAEVAARLTQYGRNELTEKPGPTFLQLVFAQLNNFIIILLLVAVVISALLGDWVEAIVILAIVVLNTVLGVVQESRAEQALEALKKMSAPEAQVLRDGSRVSVPATTSSP